MLTYGDGVADVNVPEVIKYHERYGKIGTMCMYNFDQSKGVVEVGQNGLIDAIQGKV